MSALEIFIETGFTLYTFQKIFKINVFNNVYIIYLCRVLNGQVLNRKFSNISVVEIVEILKGNINLTGCVDKSENFCEANHICLLGEMWNKLNDNIRKTFNSISLDNLLNFRAPFITEGENEIVVNTFNQKELTW